MTREEIITSATADLIAHLRTSFSHDGTGGDLYHCKTVGGCYRCSLEATISVIEDPGGPIAQMFVQGKELMASEAWKAANQAERLRMMIGIPAKQAGYSV